MQVLQRLRTAWGNDARAVAIASLGVVFLVTLQIPGTVALRLSVLALLTLLALPDIGRLRLAPQPVIVAVLAWTALAALSLVWAVDRAYSIHEFKNEFGYTLVAFLVFFVLAGSIERLLLWRNAFVAGTLALGIAAIVWRFSVSEQEFHFGPYGGPGTMITFLLVALPWLLLAGVPGWRGALPRIPVGIGVVVWLAAAWVSENRIVWPIALAATLFLLWMQARAERGAMRSWGWRWWLLGVLALAIFAAAFAGSQVKRVRSGSIDRAVEQLTVDPRVVIWKEAVRAVQTAPPTGFGVGRGVLRGRMRENTKDPMGWHGHNIVINQIISLGPLGPVALLAVLGALLVSIGRCLTDADRTRRLIALAGVTVIGVFFLRSMVDDFFYRHNLLLFWAWNGIVLGVLARK